MSRTRWVVIAVVAIAITSLLAPTAGAQNGGKALEATETGITSTTITVTVVAAIDVPGFPGLFQGIHNGLDAWAKYVNNSCKPKNTCVAGRKIEIKHVDPKLSGDAARAGFRQACDDSFALLGTGVLLLQNFDDLTQCTDKAGAASGMPDFAVVATEPNQQCSATTFVINPPPLQCATRDKHPQTYIVNTGPTDYYVKKYGKLKGAFVFPSDSASAKNAQVPIVEAQAKKGISIAYQHDLSALAQQSAYIPVAGEIRDSGANYARSLNAFDSTVKLRKEAATQGVTGVKVWDCSLQCYDSRLVAPENSAVEGEYVYIPFLPFLGKTSEAKSNKMLATFVKNTKNPDGFAIQGFSAGLYFQQAVSDAVKGNNNALTRKTLVAAARNIHDFDGGGMIAPTDVGGRKPNGCYILTQVRNGQFVRVQPKKKGEYICSNKNRPTVKLDLIK